MYEIIATEDFVNVMKDLPMKYLSFLNKSFVSIRKLDDKDLDRNEFIEDLLSQLKNQELE